MNFPVNIGPLHPHLVFDIISIFAATQLFWWDMRRRKAEWTGDEKWALAAGAFVGGALGAKIIVLFEDPAFTLAHATNPVFWATGKSIVGGLLGGLIGVEIAKRMTGITRRSGDRFVVPLAVGLALGRVGCYLSGLTDDAYGTPTSLPWGVDFGDGILRHPTQLYEIAFALSFVAAVPLLRRKMPAEGDLFRAFMVSYFAFRFAEEVLRETAHPYAGLSIYQLACAAGIAYYAVDEWRRRARAQAGLSGTPG